MSNNFCKKDVPLSALFVEVNATIRAAHATKNTHADTNKPLKTNKEENL